MNSKVLSLTMCFALILLVLIQPTHAQNDNEGLHFEVNQKYKPLSISKETLLNANTLKDLNDFYEADWVREYISVNITTLHSGKLITSSGENDILTGEQKKLLHHADPGSEIAINIEYIPNNNLKKNEAKTNAFSFIVNPDQSAKFVGGKEKLEAFLYEKAISKIDEGIFVNYDLAAVIFTINEEGAVVNPRMFEEFKDSEVQSTLLEAVKAMPCWIPAEYDNGLKVAQEFVLTVGNMANCNVHTLHIRKQGL